mmetsp:Transcript_688/g.1502  ORF Transcript_688/g.1502 Transcript_688/m.1502 type:complete len:237 (+) Transcript_688:1354-2064(+)
MGVLLVGAGLDEEGLGGASPFRHRPVVLSGPGTEYHLTVRVFPGVGLAELPLRCPNLGVLDVGLVLVSLAAGGTGVPRVHRAVPDIGEFVRANVWWELSPLFALVTLDPFDVVLVLVVVVGGVVVVARRRCCGYRGAGIGLIVPGRASSLSTRFLGVVRIVVFGILVGGLCQLFFLRLFPLLLDLLLGIGSGIRWNVLFFRAERSTAFRFFAAAPLVIRPLRFGESLLGVGTGFLR